MRLLVTRPQPDAARTATRLEALGHEVLVAPLLKTELLPLARRADPAAIAVTSRNGVRALAAWPESSAWRKRPLFAVGEATAAAAREAGFSDVRSADGDGAALAAAIVKALPIEAGRILYPAAEARSPVLEETLRAAHFSVDAVVAYRMAAAGSLPTEVTEALRSGSIDGVLLYSKRSAETFLALLDAAGQGAVLARLRLFVMSNAVAAVFRGRDVADVEVAPSPREDDLVGLIP